MMQLLLWFAIVDISVLRKVPDPKFPYSENFTDPKNSKLVEKPNDISIIYTTFSCLRIVPFYYLLGLLFAKSKRDCQISSLKWPKVVKFWPSRTLKQPKVTLLSEQHMFFELATIYRYHAQSNHIPC